MELDGPCGHVSADQQHCAALPPPAAASLVPTPLTKGVPALFYTLKTTAKGRREFSRSALHECGGVRSPRVPAFPSVRPAPAQTAVQALTPDVFKLVEPSTRHRQPSEDGDRVLCSQDKHKRPHLGEPVMPGAESVTGGVRSPLPPHRPIEQFRKTPRGQERGKKKKTFLKKIRCQTNTGLCAPSHPLAGASIFIG